MRVKILALCLLVLAARPAACQTPAAAPAGRMEIPFRLVDGVIWVEVRLNGSKPLSFLLDTAAGGDAIDRARAEELRLPLIEAGEQANVGTGDGTARLAVTENVDVAIGPARYTNPLTGVTPFDGVNRAYGERIDGLIGFGLLSRWVVTIDYLHQKLILNPNESYDYKGVGRVLPLRSSGREPIVAGAVVLGEKEYPGEFLVDAPFRRAVALATPFVQKYGLLEAVRKNGQHLLQAELTGVAGKSKNWTGRTAAFRIAGFTLPQPITDFAEATAGAFARQDIAGIIGVEILRHFVVTFDYPRRRLILEPCDEPKPSEAEMGGIVWDCEPPDYQPLKVTRVQEDSPASEASVQVGDVLVSLDGRPASELRKWQVGESLRRPGAEVVMVLRRGDKNVSVKLKLRRLV
jgi:hypothetical protein